MLRHEPPSGCLSAAASDDELGRTTTTQDVELGDQITTKANVQLECLHFVSAPPAHSYQVCRPTSQFLSLSPCCSCTSSPPCSHTMLCKPDYNVSNPLCPVRGFGTKSAQCNRNLKTTFRGGGQSPRPDKVNYNFISVSKTTCRRLNWTTVPTLWFIQNLIRLVALVFQKLTIGYKIKGVFRSMLPFVGQVRMTLIHPKTAIVCHVFHKFLVEFGLHPDSLACFSCDHAQLGQLFCCYFIGIIEMHIFCPMDTQDHIVAS